MCRFSYLFEVNMADTLKKDLELLQELQELDLQVLDAEKKVNEILNILNLLERDVLACDNIIAEINRLNVEDRISFDNIKMIVKDHDLVPEDFLTEGDEVSVCICKVGELKAKFLAKVEEYMDSLKVAEGEQSKTLKSVNTKKYGVNLIIKPEIAKIYNRLFVLFDDKIVMAHIENNTCSHCHMKTPLQKNIDVSMYDKIIFCENCGRIFC